MSKFVADLARNRSSQWRLKNSQLFKLLIVLVVVVIVMINVRFFFSSTGSRNKISQNHIMKTDIAQRNCKHTIQGKKYVSDDKGYLCDRAQLNATSGCCISKKWQYYCSQCDMKHNCCRDYEFCVSCCLGSEIPEKSLSLLPSLYETIDSKFDFCQSLCRTSSKSVVHENSYRSSLKYCFGSEPPPLKP